MTWTLAAERPKQQRPKQQRPKQQRPKQQRPKQQRPEQQRVSPMRYGIVIQYFPDKKFGFIKPDRGADIFFHVSAVGACDPQVQIEAGQAVKYELMTNSEVEFRSRPKGSKRSDEKAVKSDKPARREAKLVELIDKIPGGILDEVAEKQPSTRHPRARKKKPTWRR